MQGILRSINCDKGVCTRIANCCGSILPSEALGQLNICQSIAISCGQSSGHCVFRINLNNLGNFTGFVVLTTRILTIAALFAFLVISGFLADVPITPYMVLAGYGERCENTFYTIIFNERGVHIDSCVCKEVLIQCINNIIDVLGICANINKLSNKGGQYDIVAYTSYYDMCVRSNCADFIEDCGELCCKFKVAVQSVLNGCNHQLVYRNFNNDSRIKAEDFRLCQFCTQIEVYNRLCNLLRQNTLGNIKDLVFCCENIFVELRPIKCYNGGIDINAHISQIVSNCRAAHSTVQETVQFIIRLDDSHQQALNLIIQKCIEITIIEVNSYKICIRSICNLGQGILCILMRIQAQRGRKISNIVSISKSNVVRVAVRIILTMGGVIQRIFESILNHCEADFCAVNTGFNSINGNTYHSRYLSANILSSLSNHRNSLINCIDYSIFVCRHSSINGYHRNISSQFDSACRNAISLNCVSTYATCSSRNDFIVILYKVSNLANKLKRIALCNSIDFYCNITQCLKSNNGIGKNALSILETFNASQSSGDTINDGINLVVLFGQLCLRDNLFKSHHSGKHLFACCSDVYVRRMSKCSGLCLNGCDSSNCGTEDFICGNLCCIRDSRNSCSCAFTYSTKGLVHNTIDINRCGIDSIESIIITGHNGCNNFVDFCICGIDEVICGRAFFDVIHESHNLRHYLFIDFSKNGNRSLSIRNELQSILGNFLCLSNDSLNLFDGEFRFSCDFGNKRFDIVTKLLQLVCIRLNSAKRSFQLLNFSINIGTGVFLQIGNLSADICRGGFQLSNDCFNLAQVEVAETDVVDNFTDLVFSGFLNILKEGAKHFINDFTCEEAEFVRSIGDE